MCFKGDHATTAPLSCTDLSSILNPAGPEWEHADTWQKPALAKLKALTHFVFSL